MAGPRSSTSLTVRQAADDWLRLAKEGRAFNRSGDRFKPKVLRDYESALERFVFPALGAVRLDKVRRGDVQHLADHIGLTKSPSTVRNALMPLRTVFRYAMQRDWVTFNPTCGVALPAATRSRDRIATPDEARTLLAALPEADRGIWGTAFYAGLRLGEIQALRWADVDHEQRLLRVTRSWDAKQGPVQPKSKAGVRTVPLVAPLATLIGPRPPQLGGSALVFGRAHGRPFSHNAVRARAQRLWTKCGLATIGFHEARHTFASWMIASGDIDPKTISTYLGHSSIAITFDTYGHLMPGNQPATALKLEAYLGDRTTIHPPDFIATATAVASREIDSQR